MELSPHQFRDVYHTVDPSSARLFHGGPERIAPGDYITSENSRTGKGLRMSYFTAHRELAEESADMRNGLGHGYIHEIALPQNYQPDYGEMEAWKSAEPLKVLNVEEGKYNRPPDDPKHQRRY